MHEAGKYLCIMDKTLKGEDEPGLICGKDTGGNDRFASILVWNTGLRYRESVPHEDIKHNIFCVMYQCIRNGKPRWWNTWTVPFSNGVPWELKTILNKVFLESDSEAYEWIRETSSHTVHHTEACNVPNASYRSEAPHSVNELDEAVTDLSKYNRKSHLLKKVKGKGIINFQVRKFPESDFMKSIRRVIDGFKLDHKRAVPCHHLKDRDDNKDKTWLR